MSDRMHVATRKGLFTIERAQRGWRIARVSFLSDAAYIVAHDPSAAVVYAALGHGHFGCKLHRSSDGGSTWDECVAPAYPEPPPDTAEVKDPYGRVVPWNLELVWALEAGGSDQPGVLWCGTVPGGLFRSADGGASWTLNRPLWDHPARREWFGGGLDYPGVHSICVDPRDSRRVLVAVSCGGVWLTENGGQSWTCRSEGMWAAYMPPERRSDPIIQDPHCMVQCRTHPDALWAQHHNGVFRTRDGAASWTEVTGIQPSSFGFPVAVHPHDPDVAWLVPAVKDEHRVPVDAKVVVTRTRDGGASFDVLRQGLPQEQAYDLVFRHALDVDDSGQRLAFGSTTGSVWTSEDQGDSWTCLSNHLPPVYCVRFEKSWS